ncbi:MAG: hypothetical protein ABFD16_19460 [Thermoguttaceae bacterium]
MRVWGSVVALLLGWAAVAQAGPLNFKQIPDDAKWLAHVDVDAMRESVVVRRFYEDCIMKHGQDKHFEAVQHQFGFDPRTDLHGITFYGPKVCKDEGVLILHADVDKEGLLQKAERAPEHAVADHGSYKIHSWMHRKGKHEHKVAGTFFSNNVLVFGNNVDVVKKALDVLDGKAPSLDGKKDSPLAQALPAGTMFVARAVGLSEADSVCKSPLVKKSQWLSLVKGEHSGEVFTDGTLVTDSKEIAEQVKQVVEGLRAMALLQHSDKDLQGLINELKVSVDGKTVKIAFHASADSVASKVEKVCDELVKMHKQRQERRKLEKREL